MRTGFDFEMGGGRAIGRLYRATPEGAPRARLVSRAVDRPAGRACLLVGRLYYQSELLAKTPELSGRRFASDAELALAVFGACGPQGLTTLEGEFALVVAEPAEGRLYALRDPMGSWPLYWTTSGGRLRVGTGLLDLARRAGGARADLDHLATFLMWSFPSCELPHEHTALRAIRRVLPGRLLRFGPEEAVAVLHEHAWPVAASADPIDTGTADQRFLELFRAAVRERIDPAGTAAHLSGGMDSSAVVCVARDLLRGGDQPLSTLSLVYNLPSLAGERAYIRQVLDQGGPVAPRFLDGDRLLSFDWFASGVPEHDEPYSGLHQLPMDVGMAAEAAEAGATTVLAGLGAELVSGGLGYTLADRVRQGRWLAAYRAARVQARAGSLSLWSVLYRCGLQPLLPSWLRDGVGTLLRGGWAGRTDVRETEIPPWMHPRFARDHRLWRKGREAIRLLHRSPYESSACRFGVLCERGEWSAWHVTAAHGLHTGRPFLDPRLIAFSLALPHRLRNRSGAVKPLLQSAMTGILPERIRTRRGKQGFNDPFRLGLGRHLRQLETMVLQSPVADLEIFDGAELRAALHRVAAGVGDLSVGIRLNSALAVIAWYDRLGPALARPADEPSEVLHRAEGGRWTTGAPAECSGKPG
jgi:asparagine synthase (glutamine-hydrolysing)